MAQASVLTDPEIRKVFRTERIVECKESLYRQLVAVVVRYASDRCSLPIVRGEIVSSARGGLSCGLNVVDVNRTYYGMSDWAHDDPPLHTIAPASPPPNYLPPRFRAFGRRSPERVVRRLSRRPKTFTQPAITSPTIPAPLVRRTDVVG